VVEYGAHNKPVLCTLSTTSTTTIHLPRSREGYDHFTTFIDDKSCKVFIRGRKQKGDLHDRHADFIVAAELQKIPHRRGGEYTGECTQKLLRTHGIKHEMTTVDTPQHNGVAERMNRTLVETARTLLADAALLNSYWFDAVEYAAYLQKHSAYMLARQAYHTEEAWSGNKPKCLAYRVFGCKAFVHIPDKYRRKLDPKSLICSFIGYAPQSPCLFMTMTGSGALRPKVVGMFFFLLIVMKALLKLYQTNNNDGPGGNAPSSLSVCFFLF